MDSMDLEREKASTIRAKNAASNIRDYHIKIVDHARPRDFGGEVERIMNIDRRRVAGGGRRGWPVKPKPGLFCGRPLEGRGQRSSSL